MATLQETVDADTMPELLPPSVLTPEPNYTQIRNVYNTPKTLNILSLKSMPLTIKQSFIYASSKMCSSPEIIDLRPRN